MAANFLEANFEYFRVLTARGDVKRIELSKLFFRFWPKMLLNLVIHPKNWVKNL
jgi:hypothetical protein